MGSARGSVHWGCDYRDATTVDVEVDPQRRRFCCRESDFAVCAVPCVCVFLTAVPITKLLACVYLLL